MADAAGGTGIAAARCGVHRYILFVALSLGTLAANAQDVLAIGSASAAQGGSVQLPVSILDRSGTPLGMDASASNRIQGFAFKVLFDAGEVAAVTFTRSGIAASATPLLETTLEGDGFRSVVVLFAQPLALDLNTAAPGNRVGTLTVTTEGSAPAGSTTVLRIDPPGAMLSNQSASVVETVSAGSLSLVNATVTITGPAPANLVATAAGSSQVHLTWSAIGGASSYEVWRSFNGGAWVPVGTPASPAFTDSTVSANTAYLYRVLAVTGSGDSAFSNVDAATTIVFTDDPLVAQSTIVKLVHVTQLRTAVNAMRTSAGLPALGADGTIAAGAIVRAVHVTDLRTALSEARAEIGMSSLTFTDPVPTVIKAVHVHELRDGVE